MFPNRRTGGTLLAATLTLGLAGFVAPPTASAATCSYVSSGTRPTLRYGDTGSAVKQAQCLSNIWNGIPKLTVDGNFGAGTRTKIKWIQGCHGLTKDGVIGAGTWDALYHPAGDCYDPYPPS